MVKIISWNANSLPFKELELVTFLRDIDHGTEIICGVSEVRMDRLGLGFIDIIRHGFILNPYSTPSLRVRVHIRKYILIEFSNLLQPVQDYLFSN